MTQRTPIEEQHVPTMDMEEKTATVKEFDRQWDCRFNINSEDYLMMLVAAIEEHYAEGKIRYVLVSGIEVGTKPQHTDYQVEHVHVALILHDLMTAMAILKKWGINLSLGYYLKPRNRSLPYKGWRDHHLKEFSKKDPTALMTLERGTLPEDLKRSGTALRSEAEKRMKVDDVIREMRTLIEAGKEDEAFKTYPRNFLMYGEKLKSMVNQRKKTFFGKHIDPHIWLFGQPDLANRFWDLYNESQFSHVILEDLDSVVIDKLGVQWLKTICDEAGFAIDQKYKTPQLTRATSLVSSNQTINQLIDGLDETKCIEDTKRAIRRRFFQLRVDDLYRILGIALIPEYERKQLKRAGNEDFSKLFMSYNYALDCPTGEPLKEPESYQQLIRDFYFK
ncbi:hypothetical protein AC1031_000690 [Aphanomyces cochlioides]|nr:hypothetical protein AC1031_000690 [Aphanomyces cochlioides]